LKKRSLVACGGCDRLYVFVFLPFATPVALADMLTPFRLIYARREGYDDDPALRHLDGRECELLQRADLIITSGQILAAKCRVQEDKILDIPSLVHYASTLETSTSASICR
jgi:hypothetical protein